MRIDLIGPRGPWLLARAPWVFHPFSADQVLRDFEPANDGGRPAGGARPTLVRDRP
jgi:hypothetical protein